MSLTTHYEPDHSLMRLLLTEAGVQCDAVWSLMNILHNVRDCSNKLQRCVWRALCILLSEIENRLEREEADICAALVRCSFLYRAARRNCINKHIHTWRSWHTNTHARSQDLTGIQAQGVKGLSTHIDCVYAFHDVVHMCLVLVCQCNWKNPVFWRKSGNWKNRVFWRKSGNWIKSNHYF